MIDPSLFSESENRISPIQSELEETFEKIKSGASIREINSDAGAEIKESLNHIKRHQPELNVDERILENDDLLSINYLRMALTRARAIARISMVKNGQFQGYGTGFLISPGLLMTNHHVIENEQVAAGSIVEFNYEIDLRGFNTPTEKFQLNPDRFFVTSPKEELDYTIIAIEDRSEKGASIQQFGHIPLIRQTGKVIKGQCLTIIQHPSGGPKKLALRENYLLKKLPHHLIYKTDTCCGSSGSPVFNDFWELVALHHSGVPERNAKGEILSITGDIWKEWMGEDKVKWKGNEGIRISQIVADLELKAGQFKPHEREILDNALGIADPITVLTPAFPETKNIPALAAMPAEVKLPDIPVRNQLLELLLTDNPAMQKMAVREINTRFNAVIEPLFPDLNNESKNSALRRFIKVIVPSAEIPWDLARSLATIEGVEDVDPILETVGIDDRDQELPLLESTASAAESNKDRLEKEHPGLQPDWNHVKTNFSEAIEFSRSKGRLKRKTGIKVAQIDTGYSDHPEIELMAKSEGFDYVGLDENARDDRVTGFLKHPGHGTRTGGVLIGVQTDIPSDFNHGVFPYVDLIPYRVANSVVIIGTARNVSHAVLNAVQSNCAVITMSMGSYGRRSWKEMAKYAYDNGVIWVCAAGNEVRKLAGMVVRPAKYKGTIAVAATNYEDEPWYHSSRGKAVDISAPGENVYVPVQLEEAYNYNYGSGTSYATPHIAAAAALWLHHHKKEIRRKYKEPWQQVEAFRYVLKKTARKPRKWNKKMGAGILDALALLKAELPDPQQLSYAYGSTVFLEATRKQQPSITEKELFYYVWNKPPEGSSGLLEVMPKNPLSDKANSFRKALNLDKDQLLEYLDDKC